MALDLTEITALLNRMNQTRFGRDAQATRIVIFVAGGESWELKQVDGEWLVDVHTPLPVTP